MKVFIASFLAALIAIPIGYFIGVFTRDMNSRIVVLEEPLIIKSGEDKGTIPKGTTLFFDKGSDEGFSRYKVYINIDGKPYNLKESEKKWYIAPIWGESDD